MVSRRPLVNEEERESKREKGKRALALERRTEDSEKMEHREKHSESLR
jgi:hypothetical protein